MSGGLLSASFSGIVTRASSYRWWFDDFDVVAVGIELTNAA